MTLDYETFISRNYIEPSLYKKYQYKKKYLWDSIFVKSSFTALTLFSRVCLPSLDVALSSVLSLLNSTSTLADLLSIIGTFFVDSLTFGSSFLLITSSAELSGMSCLFSLWSFRPDSFTNSVVSLI